MVQTVLRDFCVDDLLTSVIEDDTAKCLVENIIRLMKNGGFNLTKFDSNSPEVLEKIPQEKRAVKKSVEFEDTITRALGMRWNLKEDHFLYFSNVDTKQTVCTKRSILKKTASVFDPLGFLTPFTLIAKLILQDLWRLKVEWDEEVNENTSRNDGKDG